MIVFKQVFKLKDTLVEKKYRIRHQNLDKFKFEFSASFDFGDRSLLTLG